MKRRWKILIGLCLSLVMFFLVINVIPFKKAVLDANPFIKGKTLIAAHRGGKELNPENTMKAFSAAVINYKVDILELDICLTKDNELVVIHDLYINEYCDVELLTNSNDKAYVEDFTYDELQNFNFGYNFFKNGKYVYRNLVTLNQPNRKEVIKFNNLNLIKFEDLVKSFYESYPDLMYIVEIKNYAEKGEIAADKLASIINNYPKLKKQLVASTFHDDVARYLNNNYKDIIRGASVGEATSFILTEMFKVGIFDNPNYYCLQIPMNQNVWFLNFNLMKKSYIKAAHKKNIAIQYWTVNTVNDMKKLLNLKVDCIMTDNPERLYNVAKEMGLR